jgi:hypothetical protein
VQAGGTPPSGDLVLSIAFAAGIFILGARLFISHERDFAMRL